MSLASTVTTTSAAPVVSSEPSAEPLAGEPSPQVAMRHKLARFCQTHGGWTNHNIHLGHGVYTLNPEKNTDDQISHCFRRVVQDTLRQDWTKLRVLDLACLEGKYALDMAAAGATSLGIDVREAPLRRANFAREQLGLQRASFVQDDVRNLSVDKYGEFDVVLCAGILYHLAAPDVFAFLRHMREVCRGITLIDTHVALLPIEQTLCDGQSYFGWNYQEHAPNTSTAQKIANTWASIDNDTSFFLTRASLYNALLDAGYSSVYEVHAPGVPGRPADRVIFAALPGAASSASDTPASKNRWSEFDPKFFLDPHEPLAAQQHQAAAPLGLSLGASAPSAATTKISSTRRKC